MNMRFFILAVLAILLSGNVIAYDSNDLAKMSNCFGTSHDNLDLTNAVFKNKQICNAYNSKLESATFDGVLCNKCDFDSSQFDGAKFIGSTVISNSSFTNASFTNAEFRVDDFKYSFRGTDFSGATWIHGEKCEYNSVGCCKVNNKCLEPN